MLFLGIRKDPFNGFLAHLIVSFVPLRIAQFLCHVHIRLPDVLRYRLNEVLIPGTQRSGGAVCASLWITFIFPVAVTVGCGVFQYLVFRADDTVIVFVIHILPPFMSALHGLGTLVGCIQNPAVIKYFLADMRGLVGAVHYHSIDFGVLLYQFIIYVVESYAVMYIAGSYFYFQNIAVLVADGMAS